MEEQKLNPKGEYNFTYDDFVGSSFKSLFFAMIKSVSQRINTAGKIQAYFTPTFPKVDKWGAIEEEAPQKPCKPEHKVDGKVPMLYDIHFDGRSCDCGRVRYVSEECGCSIKEYRLIKIPNE